MENNFLQFNQNKTEVILFGPSHLLQNLRPTLGPLEDNIGENVKNLGVIFDPELKFDKQINSVVRTSFLQLRGLRKLKSFLSFNDLEVVIHAFISIRLDYCNSLYAGINQFSLSRLQLVQNAAARFLTGTKKRESITPVLASLHLLPVKFRVDFKVLVFVFKALHGLALIYISDRLHFYSPVRTLISSSQKLLIVPKFRLKSKGNRAFSVLGLMLWNSLPLSIRSSPTLSSFKSFLKTYLFSQAFV